MKSPPPVVSGGAKGVDSLGEWYANKNNIPIDRYIPDWKPNGIFDRGAGHKRNKIMAENAEALIAVWDGKSAGTKNMINNAVKLGLKYYVHKVTVEYYANKIWIY